MDTEKNIEDTIVSEPEATAKTKESKVPKAKNYKVISVKPTFVVLLSEDNEIQSIACDGQKYNFGDVIEL